MSTDYVLVHGAGAGNWVWDHVTEALRAHRSSYAVVHGSHPRPSAPVNRVVVGDLPGHGHRRHEDLSSITLDDYADAVVGWIEENQLQNVVLVGHSMGGLVLPLVAARMPGRIKRLVFASALVPLPGGRGIESLPLGRRLLFRLGAWVTRARRRGFPPLHKALAYPLLCNGMAPGPAGAIIARLTPYPLRPFLTPATADEQGGPPSTYVVFTRDRVLPPSLQRRMARNLRTPEVVEVAGGHVSALYLKASDIANLLAGYA